MLHLGTVSGKPLNERCVSLVFGVSLNSVVFPSIRQTTPCLLLVGLCTYFYIITFSLLSAKVVLKLTLYMFCQKKL